MTSQAMTKFRALLKMELGTKADAGLAGEELTRRLLDLRQISYFSIEQGIDTKSEKLKAIGAKRVDFVVGCEGTSLLLDSKCQSPTRHDDGSVTYNLEEAEIARLEATGKEFGMEVALIFWDRKARNSGQRYVIATISRLNAKNYIGDKSALSATFSNDEITSVELY